MSDVSLVFNATGRDRGVNALLARTAAGVRGANVAAAASTAAVGVAMAGAAAKAVALGSAVGQTVGALGLLPSAIGVIVAAVSAAKAVTFGLGEAWKTTGAAAASGGGSAASTAQRVAAAHREVRQATQALADAQRDARLAQLALVAARQAEAERLDDLARAVAGARLDEEGAVLAVTRAERELRRLRSQGGSRDDIAAADLAYRQSLQTLADVRDRVGDLSAEQADGAAKGVEGSDAVQDALRRQEDAQRAVVTATERLADAQRQVAEASRSAAGGVDAAAVALGKLSPNGRAVVLMLRQLAPGWAAAARAGQQATFAGAAGILRDLSGVYLPRATNWLARIGGAFNDVIRDAAGLAGSRRTIADVDTILDSTVLTVRRLGAAVRPVLNAILQFAAVGSSFLPGIAGSVGDIAGRFERWAVAARESGKINQWIGTALSTLRQLAAVGGNVAATVAAIFSAGGDGGSTLDSLVSASAAMRAWAESAEGQERISSGLATLRGIVDGLASALPVLAGQAGTLDDTLSVAGTVVSGLAQHTDLLAKALPLLAAGFLASKVAQTGANAAAVVMLPLRVVEMARTWGMTAALRAHTTALIANTATQRGATAATIAGSAATTVGEVATKRSLVSMIALKGAQMAGTVATGIATAAQWLHNAAWYGFPVVWIIAAIIAVIAVIILIVKYHKEIVHWIGQAWDWIWEKLKAFGGWIANTLAPMIWQWLTWPYRKAWEFIGWIWGLIVAGVHSAQQMIIDKFRALLAFITSIPSKIGSIATHMWDSIKNSFRSVINFLISAWNRLDFGISISIPDWVPGIGGRTFGIADIVPDLPMLAGGGTATRAGLAVVGERGAEVVRLPAGASVFPADRVGGDGGGRTITIRLTGADSAFKRFFRELLRDNPDLLVVNV
jgi:hypothetical protein